MTPEQQIRGNILFDACKPKDHKVPFREDDQESRAIF